MKNLTNRRLMWLAPTLALPLSLGLAMPQEQEAPKVKPWEQLSEAGAQAQDDPRKQMEEAFKKVELGLEQMNQLLIEASKGDTTRLQKAKNSGIDELLKLADKRPQGDATSALSELLYASGAEGQRVLDGIDQILEIAASNGNPNSC